MSGFFTRMAERGAGTERTLRLRPPQRFEPGPADLEAISEPPAPAPARAAAPVLPEPGPAQERESLPPAAGVPAAVAPLVAAPAVEVPPAERAEPGAPVREPAVVPPPPVEVTEPPAPREEAEPPAPAREVAAPPPPVSHTERPAPVSVEASRAPPPPPPARDRPPPRRTSRTPEVDVVTLLREHVVPLLVERGVVRRSERPVIVERPAASAGAPTPGTISVAPDAVARDDDEAAPQVNLHIDRIVVTRAPAPAPSVPAPPRQTVDHEGYLARREARR